MARVPTLVSQGRFLQGQSQMLGIHHKGDPQTLPPMLEIIRTRELLEASGSQTNSTVTSVNCLGTLPMNAPQELRSLHWWHPRWRRPNVDHDMLDFKLPDDDYEDPDDRVSFLRFTAVYQTKEEKAWMSLNETPCLMVVRCALTLRIGVEPQSSTDMSNAMTRALGSLLTGEVVEMWFLPTLFLV